MTAITIITIVGFKYFLVFLLTMKAEGADNLNVKIFREICPPTIPSLWKMGDGKTP